MKRRRNTDAPVAGWRSLFRPVYFDAKLLEAMRRALVVDAFESGSRWAKQWAENEVIGAWSARPGAVAELAELQRRDPKAWRRLLVLKRDLMIGMDFALRKRSGEKVRPGKEPGDALGDVAASWGVGERTAERARDAYMPLALLAIDEYVNGHDQREADKWRVPEAAVLQQLRHNVDLMRERLVCFNGGTWTRRRRKPTQ